MINVDDILFGYDDFEESPEFLSSVPEGSMFYSEVIPVDELNENSHFEEIGSESNFLDQSEFSHSFFGIEASDFNLVESSTLDILEHKDFSDSIWNEDSLDNTAVGGAFNGLFPSFNINDSSKFLENYIEVHGTPESELQFFDQQDADYSCAVATTNMMLNSIGLNVGEETLSVIFENTGIYDPMKGTDPCRIDDVLNDIANSVNLPFGASEVHGFTKDYLIDELNNGSPMLIAVDAGVLHDFVPPGSGHAVLLTGIVETPEGTMAVVNDPGFPEGAGQVFPYEQFEKASDPFNNLAIKMTTYA